MDSTDYYNTTLDSYDYTPYTTSTASDAEVAAAWGFLGAYSFFWLAFAILYVVSMWRIFTKAGRPGWAAIIPFYNMYTLLKVAGRPGWWLILLLIPFVNVVVLLIVSLDVAKAFGKSTLFGVVGLWLFSVIGYAILAFSHDKYLGPKVD